MALHEKGQYRYGDSQEDIRAELTKYSQDNGYSIDHFADAKCSCGNRAFRLLIDAEEGAAVRYCKVCGTEHPIGDSAEYLEDAELGEAECSCGSNTFEITGGVALYGGTQDVKWFYLGCRCVECGLTACFGDWKNEYIGYKEFLEAV